MDINIRIRRFCEYNKIKQSDLVRRGIGSTQTLSNIFNNKQKPGFDVIHRFAKAYPEINLRWLILGHGEMIKNAAGFAKQQDNTTGQYSKLNEERAFLMGQIELLKEDRQRLEKENIKMREIIKKHCPKAVI